MAPNYRSYRYLGIDELGDTRHIIVDGAARPHTTLVLSHWPASPTPEVLWRDLSAEIAQAYLAHPELWDDLATAVSNDHPDIDGLISLFFLTNPTFALEHATLLADVARIGDFGVVRTRLAAQVAWTLETLMDAPELISAELVDADVARSSSTTLVYRSLLQALPRIIEFGEAYQSFYKRQEERFDATVAQISSGAITFEEFNDVELAVFRADPHLIVVDDAQVGRDVLTGFDPFALHSATSMPRILVSHGQRFVLYDRYETWVRFVSRRYQLRRDLRPLAKMLSEADTTEWSADAPNTLEPALWHGEAPSGHDLPAIVEFVRRYLASAPVAWDPFRASPLVTVGAADT